MEGVRVATVLLRLSLVAAACCLSAAAADVDTIRLPSQDEVANQAGAEKRPWKCCDRAMCTRSIPPFCKCLDLLDRCPAGCKDCRAEREHEADPESFVCHDVYRGAPGPNCSTNGDKVVADEATIVAAEEKKAAAAEAEKRPWKCCDDTLCNRAAPPTCRCLDTVDRCAASCRECVAAGSDPSRRVCKDRFHGWPGPKCSNNQ